MKRLVIYRIIFVVLTAMFLLTFVAGVPARYQELTMTCEPDACDEFIRLTEREAALLSEAGFSVRLYSAFQIGLEAIIVCLMTGIALLIFWKRSDDWMALVVALALVAYGASLLIEGDGALARAWPSLTWIFTFQTYLSVLLLMLLVYLFPGGQFTPPLMKYVLIAFLLALAVLAIRAGNTSRFITMNDPMTSISLLMVMALGISSQVYRYQYVSTPIERQQTKWIIVGLAMACLAMFGWFLLWEFTQPGPFQLWASTVGMVLLLLMLLAVPVTIAFSVLRYRLWDIDVIIRRTLIYGAITALLASVYFGVVVVIQSVFRAISGQESQLAVVLSTLAIAALFTPLRNRMQSFVDRRFYRQKYDAERTLDAFAETTRNDVNLEDIRVKLIALVDETLQPEHLSLWLASPDRGKD